MRYIKPLDGLRAIAALFVIIWHWIPQDSFINQFPNGYFGVNIFFVLSGFLITHILLIHRVDAEAFGMARKNLLQHFYIRRALRIFPIFYLTLSLMVVLRHQADLKLTMSELIASATYTYNFFLFSVKSWDLASIHFWSLAVEEQFYLVWPLLMLYLPKRYLLYCMLLFILIGVSSQLLLSDTNFGPILPHTCFDCLGIGGLLAWVVINKPSFLQKFYHLTVAMAIAGVVLVVCKQAAILSLKQDRFAHAMIGVWLITHVWVHQQKPTALTFLLSTKVLVNIGKVSYGIYLYHILFEKLVRPLWIAYVYPHFQTIQPIYLDWAFLVVNVPILYGICWLSWQYIEHPILQLKDKVSYQKPVTQNRHPTIVQIGKPEPIQHN